MLPADRERLIDLLDQFLALSAAEQAELALEARVGVARRPGAPLDAPLRRALQARVAGADEAETDEKLEAAKRFRAQFL